MKLKELKNIIKEELNNIQKEYTPEDLFYILKSEDEIKVSTDGGHSYSVYKKYGWDKTGNKHLEDFKIMILDNSYFEGKTFIKSPTGKNRFELKDTEAPDLSSYYDKKTFTGD